MLGPVIIRRYSRASGKWAAKRDRCRVCHRRCRFGADDQIIGYAGLRFLFSKMSTWQDLGDYTPKGWSGEPAESVLLMVLLPLQRVLVYNGTRHEPRSCAVRPNLGQF
jgi:hypothetical protein